MYLLSQTAEQYTMLPVLLGWKANTKKAAYASRTSSPKVKHLIHLVNQCTAKVLKISRRRDKVAHFSHAGSRHFGRHLDV